MGTLVPIEIQHRAFGKGSMYPLVQNFFYQTRPSFPEKGKNGQELLAIQIIHYSADEGEFLFGNAHIANLLEKHTLADEAGSTFLCVP